ncbi:glycoside hydrolase family 30 protein [Ureibacillus aquaedulcis]|uniref:Glycoside hydrolase family 30 beta sandwich domain-containing protein n=1 Tax=Ureibacillus aquaedulcis TaxID=3058421 RepID=A0ABT8GRF4_9BACL|nr:glycoside hydrolase family 30 beta sandwich domain-containing protein [Ureibacillus sp. BA0131]MDN4493983.1 glycoside hydrolase family 30 beta sandwich domain-containing protein [Ureibacillus sp. BA0131]
MNINKKTTILLVLALLLSVIAMIGFTPAQNRADVFYEKEEEITQYRKASVWLTTGDQQNLLTSKSPLLFSDVENKTLQTLTIDRHTTYQTMEGFGAAITGSSAYLIQKKLDESAREALLKDMFTENGINIGYIRHTIGASDFSVDENGNPSSYSYNDTNGELDLELNHFTIEKDQDVITAIQAALEKKRDLKIIGTPWTAPAWMKYGEKALNGGYLDYTNEEIYRAYANYFVRYVQAYQQKGIPVDSITIQNEPGFTSPSYPSMSMSPEEQAKFIGQYLGPAFDSNGIDTKIISYDHNWEGALDYTTALFQNEDAKKYTDGIAFHCYKGNPDAMNQVHTNFPDKNIYFTECSSGGWSKDFRDNFSWQMSNLIIGAPRNWAKNVLMWNITLDENGGPTNGGCENCQGVVTINQGTGEVKKNAEYYAIGHASKFVESGAVRIFSTTYPGSIESVAFQNPDQSTVLIATNPSEKEQQFQLNDGGAFLSYTLPPKSAVTFTWESFK